MQTRLKVLDGLEITVEFSIDKAEPEVGIFRDEVSEWEIVEIGRKAKTHTEWLVKRIEDAGEESSVVEACLREHFTDWLNS